MVAWKLLLFLSIALNFSLAYTKESPWQKVLIPGAKCGDGEDYLVYLQVKDPKKLLVTFTSGGACWSKSTCHGPNLRTIIHLRKKEPKVPVFARKNERFAFHSIIALPYCTGDVFAGRHVATYEDKQVHHVGALNVEKMIEHFKAEKVFDFSDVKDLVVYGSSAGGIGALIHARKFQKQVAFFSKKTLISDSPGLHFGKSFWDKFTPQQRDDFRTSFKSIDFNPPLDDGFVAPYLGETCHKLRRWDIGFIMGSKDMVMSKVFGDISMKEHEQLVFSPGGIAHTLENYRNCAVWLKRSKIHTFLLGMPAWRYKVQGQNALDFINGVHTYRFRPSLIEWEESSEN